MKSPRNPKAKPEYLGDVRSAIVENQENLHQYDRTVDLDKLNEDVITVRPIKASRGNRSHLTSGAQSVLTNSKQEEIRDIRNSSQTAPTLYVENCLGFSKKTIQQHGIGIDDRSRQDLHKSLKENDLLNTNPGVKYVVNIHRVFSLICNTIFGILAGASLVHTLVLQVVTGPKNSSPMNNMNLNTVVHYSENARPIAITYFVVLVVTGVYILDKFDFGRPSISCMRGCIKFQNGVLAVPFLVASFGINNAMVWLDYKIHQLAYPQYGIIPQYSQDYITYAWKIWSILDASRTVFIMATWIILSFCEKDYDRLVRNLCRDLDQEIDE